jgi:hypothetical protein
VITDPLPEVFKEYFFQSQEQPHLISEYDCVGFDVDHCLVKYKIPELALVAVKSYLKELCSAYGYPKEIMKFEKKDLKISHHGVVWDIKNGTLLKMTESRRVTHCCKGFESYDME